jgi:biofilm protein TabA
MKTGRFTSAILLFLITANLCIAQQWTPASAKKWVKSREWANGSDIKLSPSVNDVEFAKQYHANKAIWDKAIAFLNDKKLDTLKPGKYLIDGDNVYAMITEGPTKDFDKSAWESHRNYIDLHNVIRGKEKIGAAPVASATVILPYDAAKDIANYTAEGKFYDAVPGEFFLFFPTDAHRPGIKADGIDSDKKLVIKIKYISSN